MIFATKKQLQIQLHYYIIKEEILSKKNKLIKRLYTVPSDFTYDELRQLLKYFGFREVETGKTSGSAVKYYNRELGVPIYIHRPHPGNIVKKYVLRELIRLLSKEEL